MSKKDIRQSNITDEPETWKDSEQSSYQPPQIVSYTSEAILEQVGPAQACSPSPCGIF